MRRCYGARRWREWRFGGVARWRGWSGTGVFGRFGCGMGGVVRAPAVFLATGKHDVRGWARPEGTQSGLLGFKMYCRLSAEQYAALGSAVELILFPGGYAGLQPVEAGQVNLCLLVSSGQFKEAGSSWTGLLASLLERVAHLGRRLSGARYLLDAPLAASRIPYGHLQGPVGDGLWRVGDQAAVIPSFCGDGMAIAMHSGVLAAQTFARGVDAETYQRELRGQLRGRIAFATRLSQLLVAFPTAGQVTRVVPGLLSHLASVTRIPARALL